MVKVITYGTYDYLHYGHIQLLKRAKALGDYLIVAVTASDFDQRRGKINVRQSLAERMEAVRALNIADEIIVEEYEGQKIDDICRTGADIFTVGSDWEGKFDYLKEYCKVIYLPRTEGVSSSGIRQKGGIRLGLAGDALFLNKIAKECQFVNGVELAGIYTNYIERMSAGIKSLEFITNQYDALLDAVDAVYIHTSPDCHYGQVKEALKRHKHVLCHSPIALKEQHARELLELARDEECVLLDGIKTAYSTAFERMLLLLKSGLIGRVVSVDATCTRLKADLSAEKWTNLCAWGPIAMLPVFKILGTRYLSKSAAALFEQDDDIFAKIDFLYSNAVASIKIGKKVKSEGELVISGSKGYVYVPAPWWKTDYFEIRYENPKNNKRYFYQLDGEGIRYELAAFVQMIQKKWVHGYLEPDISIAVSKVIEDFYQGKDIVLI